MVRGRCCVLLRPDWLTGRPGNHHPTQARSLATQVAENVEVPAKMDEKFGALRQVLQQVLAVLQIVQTH